MKAAAFFVIAKIFLIPKQASLLMRQKIIIYGKAENISHANISIPDIFFIHDPICLRSEGLGKIGLPLAITWWVS